MIRERREELVTPIPFAANGVGQITNGVPRDLPLTKILLSLEGRLTVSGQTVAGNYYPEAPATLIRNITLRGTKVTGGGAITLVNCRGEELQKLTRFYLQYIPVGSGDLVGPPTILSLNDSPGAGGTAFPAGLAATANGSFDFRVFYIVPIAPWYASHGDEIVGILDPSIFSQLDLLVSFGDTTFLQTGATATFALSAFGSASGNPQVVVHRFSPLGAGLPINKYHYTYLSKQVAIGSLGAAATDTKITDLNAGNKLRTVMLRQYSQAAGKVGLIDQSAGASLARIGDGSNPGTFRYRIKLNGAEKARYRNPELREFDRILFSQFNSLMPLGYSVVEWGDRGFLDDIFDARGFGATATRFEVFGDWTGLTANDFLDVLQVEQLPVEV